MFVLVKSICAFLSRMTERRGLRTVTERQEQSVLWILLLARFCFLCTRVVSALTDSVPRIGFVGNITGACNVSLVEYCSEMEDKVLYFFLSTCCPPPPPFFFFISVFRNVGRVLHPIAIHLQAVVTLVVLQPLDVHLLRLVNK